MSFHQVTIWTKGALSVVKTHYGQDSAWQRYNLNLYGKCIATCMSEKVWQQKFKGDANVFAEKKIAHRLEVIGKEKRRLNDLINDFDRERVSLETAQKLMKVNF